MQTRPARTHLRRVYCLRITLSIKRKDSRWFDRRRGERTMLFDQRHLVQFYYTSLDETSKRTRRISIHPAAHPTSEIGHAARFDSEFHRSRHCNGAFRLSNRGVH